MKVCQATTWARGRVKKVEEAERFKSKERYEACSAFLDSWKGEARGVRVLFFRLKSALLKLEGTRLDFRGRPGVSYSLRGEVPAGGNEKLFILVDVVDDDPENRWLSVCFYAEAVSDPEGMGDLIPGGLLGKDAYCFDVFGEDDVLLGYLEERIGEAFEKAMSGN